MLSLQGNTAPYLQNAYVRIRSIFRKAGESAVGTPLGSVKEQTGHRPVVTGLALTNPAEINLAKRLCQFAEIVPQVLNDFRPNVLANYLFEVANSFHTFYEACPVLKSDEPARSSRLALCECHRASALSRSRLVRHQKCRRNVTVNDEPQMTNNGECVAKFWISSFVIRISSFEMAS